ncbi:aminotransferase class V-fold PLP-dependent enzyme [Nocardioides sp. AE5]|uniref:kynureninase n=1 Tax=Nocardioides sp. AE5 TaxID=2962573 RepID=UPI002881D7DA|nr:aminotransferase class V-fold PLP-dependent enzyme [Nocardioides sp. AE5]MDT0202139.1 aminotransferase class V-fold PLP-dependent enzyme [Nocardioides sp. AE5]
MTYDDIAAWADRFDAADPLAAHAPAFVEADGVHAYLDGNSLGRPLKATRDRLVDFLDGAWGERLIRSWDEQWFHAPTEVGDRIAALTLGSGPGQTIVADSTTVLLYKLVRAAVDGAEGRDEIVIDTGNFPTDRFVVEGIAAERGLRIRMLDPDPAGGVTADDVRAVVGERTALVLLSHVAYRSGHLADLVAITEAAHTAGAMVLWDLCHSVGVVDFSLDDAGVDLAVGCTYKYLNGGPGSPAFGYVSHMAQDRITQPIQGWMGAADPFAMGPSYVAADGIRAFISGTPPILAMQPMLDMLDLVEQAGIAAIRAKSVALTTFATDAADELLAPLGVRLASPRDPDLRGGHVTLAHPDFREVTARAWQQGVIPDFRPPDGLRIGLSPLSTTFAEVARGIGAVATLLSPEP